MPWKPATMTILPASSWSKIRRLLMLWMRALEKAVSVTSPICPPVKLIASWPWAQSAIAIRAIVTCSPVASSWSISRLGGWRLDAVDGAHLRGQVDQVVGRVAHGADDDDDLVPGLLGGHGPGGRPVDALGVGHAGPAELLDDQGHGGGRW